MSLALHVPTGENMYLHTDNTHNLLLAITKTTPFSTAGKIWQIV